MTTTTHSVAPEDIMAWLDGELSTSEAEAVTHHLDHCIECAALADDLRNTSQALARWIVPAIPQDLENRVRDLATKAAATNKTIKPRRRSSASGKLWAFGSLGVLSVFLVFFWPSTDRRHYSARPQAAAPAEPPKRMVWEAAPVTPEFRAAAQKAESLTYSDTAADVPAPTSSPLPAANYASNDAGDGSAKTPPTPAAVATLTPMIARSVSLTIQVRNVETARTSLEQILARHHGYSAQLNSDTAEDSARTLRASLRIPAPELAATVADIKPLGRVENEVQSGEEVTQQHRDLVARLITARGTEERLRAILQQRTGKVSDVLEVEEEIARVRGEIESMEAEQKNLEHRVDFATIDIQFTEEYKAQLNSPDNSATTRIHNAFVAGYHNASDTLLGFLLFFEEYGPTILIWLVILAVPVLLGWRRYRRLRSRL